MSNRRAVKEQQVESGRSWSLQGVHAEDDATEREARFAEFVASRRERAVRLAWRLLGGDSAAAEDVAQDAFVRAHRALGRFRGEASFDTWFYRILVRQAHNQRRWRALRERWHAGSEIEVPDPSSGATGDPLLRRRIARALDALTRRQREAFVLVHMEGLRVREAAQVLGKPEGTVKSHLHRALTHLRGELEDLRTETREGRR